MKILKGGGIEGKFSRMDRKENREGEGRGFLGQDYGVSKVLGVKVGEECIRQGKIVMDCFDWVQE